MELNKICEALPVGRALVAAKYGLFLVLVNDKFIGRSLMYAGEYSSGEIDILEAFAKPGQLVIEVGANIGALTVPYAKHLKKIDSRILCYEPQPEIFHLLNANIALNAIENASVRNIGLGSQSKTIFFTPPDYMQMGNFGGVELDLQGEGGSDAVLLKISTLDDEMANVEHSLGILKIDVEGMELDVLRGACKTIQKYRPIIYLENDRVERSPELCNFLIEKKYELYWHMPELISKTNFFNYPLADNERIISINMLALPCEKKYDSFGLKKVNPQEHPFLKVNEE
jgi:FkbM family methyltransferase